MALSEWIGLIAALIGAVTSFVGTGIAVLSYLHTRPTSTSTASASLSDRGRAQLPHEAHRRDSDRAKRTDISQIAARVALVGVLSVTVALLAVPKTWDAGKVDARFFGDHLFEIALSAAAIWSLGMCAYATVYWISVAKNEGLGGFAKFLVVDGIVAVTAFLLGGAGLFFVLGVPLTIVLAICLVDAAFP